MGDFAQKVNHSPKSIGVIGLGYVGLPLALLFAKQGFQVTGIDVDEEKVKRINRGVSDIVEVQSHELQTILSKGVFKATSDYSVNALVDVVIICVPTPLTKDHLPDMSYLVDAAESLVPWMKPGKLIILESSTYPGTTREVLKPILERSGLKAGGDFYLGYSPERVDPGNKSFGIGQVPKVAGGISEECLKEILQLYNQVFDQVVAVSSTETAEMTKLLENSYRFINISFINEFAINCAKLNIDVWEVIKAASTKPFGFSPFYPGPGVGGHCIPIDPIYLSWKLRQKGMDNQFIALSDRMNRSIISYIVDQVVRCVLKEDRDGAPHVLLCGVTYKKDVKDLRESPALSMIRMFQEAGIHISFHDPLINEIVVDGHKFQNIPITPEVLQKMDGVVILTNHSDLPVQQIVDFAKLVYDTRNATRGFTGKAEIIRYGTRELYN